MKMDFIFCFLPFSTYSGFHLSKPQFSEFKAEGRRQEAEGKIRIFFPSALCPLPPAFFEMWLTELAIAVKPC
jgi:hypothetical protein